MASGSEKTVGVSLFCPACSKAVTDPRILPCLHSICKACIEKQLNGHYQCPVCKEISNEIRSLSDIDKLPIDNLLLSILDMVTLHGGKMVCCDVCDESERSNAVCRCKECAQYFCSLHSSAHKTARNFKGHTMLDLNQLRKYPLKDLRRPLFCREHGGEMLRSFCETCDKVVCKHCCSSENQNKHIHVTLDEAIQKYNMEIKNILQNANDLLKEMEDTLPQLDLVASNVNSKAKNILCDIDVIIDYQITTLLKRKKDLRSQVQEIRKSKLQALKEQQEELKSSLIKLQQACKFTEITMTTSSNHNDATALVLKSHLTSRLKHFMDKKSEYLEPVEDSFLELHCDDSLLHRAIETFGRLHTTYACPKECIARGVGIKAALETEPNKFTVFLMNQRGKRLERPDGAVTVDIMNEDGRRVNVDSIVAKHDGTYEVTYNPMQRGSLTIAVKVQGEQIKGSPFLVPISSDLKKSWI